MDLNDIQIFAKVVESKSLTVASDLLSIPKSTLSRRLALLEEHLGVQLVQRTTRHFSLTDAGMAYYVRCTEILTKIMAANQFVSDLQDAPRGRLRLSAAPAFAARYLGPVISTFTAAYPEITIEVLVTERVGNLLDDGIDLAITCSKSANDSRRETTVLGAGVMMLCAAPSYLARRAAPQKIEDLYAHELVLYMPDGIQSFSLTDGTSTHEISPPAQIMSDHYEPIRDALVAGAGIGCLSDITIAREFASGALVRVLPGWTAGGFEVVATYPKRQTTPPRLEVFLEHLIRSFTPAPWRREAAPVVEPRVATERPATRPVGTRSAEMRVAVARQPRR